MPHHEEATAAAQNGSESAAQGPPGDLPAAVPDFVSEILATVDSVVGSGSEELGEAIGEIAANGMAGDAAATVVDVVGVVPV